MIPSSTSLWFSQWVLVPTHVSPTPLEGWRSVSVCNSAVIVNISASVTSDPEASTRTRLRRHGAVLQSIIKAFDVGLRHHIPFVSTASAQVNRVTEAWMSHADYLLEPLPVFTSQFRVVLASLTSLVFFYNEGKNM